MPAHVINKGIASSRLLAHVLVAKYADHLPLYRQQQRFAREGIELPISTMADWVGRCGMQLQPFLVDALREELLLKSVLHVDETPINVLRADKGCLPNEHWYPMARAQPKHWITALNAG